MEYKIPVRLSALSCELMVGKETALSWVIGLRYKVLCLSASVIIDSFIHLFIQSFNK